MRIRLADPDPQWPALFDTLARRTREALGDRVLVLEHVGSTSVPALAAKPIVDMLLQVPDVEDEAAYVPALEAVAFRFHLREPEWYAHRLLKGTDIAANLHVFGTPCEEADHMLEFRDRLRADEAARDLYENTKRSLATRDWAVVQEYADAKTDVIHAILGR